MNQRRSHQRALRAARAINRDQPPYGVPPGPGAASDNPAGDAFRQADGHEARNGPGIDTDWQSVVAPFLRPSSLRACLQIVDSVGTYLVLWVGLYFLSRFSLLLSLPVAGLAALVLVRVFIISHDCGHGSFFRSRFANDLTGRITALLGLTPYLHWKVEHAIHHRSAGDLERRGVGDIWTMTVQEYIAASRWRRFSYRLARNPFVLFGVAPFILFMVLHRWPRKGSSRRERWSVWLTNLGLAGMAVAGGAIFGIVPFTVLFSTVVFVAGAVGVGLFYLQHQFEEAYWVRGSERNHVEAALKGSSFFKLPRILQWFSGNIGFHHVHHLHARIPNYRLQRCHESNPMFLQSRAITLSSSIPAFRLRLWDELSGRLVGFTEVKALRRRRRAGRGAFERKPRPQSRSTGCS